jgi:hypothetical protein
LQDEGEVLEGGRVLEVGGRMVGWYDEGLTFGFVVPLTILFGCGSSSIVDPIVEDLVEDLFQLTDRKQGMRGGYGEKKGNADGI